MEQAAPRWPHAFLGQPVRVSEKRLRHDLEVVFGNDISNVTLGQHGDVMAIFLEDDLHSMHPGQAFRRAVLEPCDAQGTNSSLPLIAGGPCLSPGTAPGEASPG